MKLVHWPLIGGLLHLAQQKEDWAGLQPAQAPFRCTKCNSPPSTASVPITVLLYNGPLPCGFDALIKGSNDKQKTIADRSYLPSLTRVRPKFNFSFLIPKTAMTSK